MKIKERKFRSQIVFDVYYRDSDGHEVVNHTVYVPYVRLPRQGAADVRIIYDERMRPIESIFWYLNKTLIDQGMTDGTIDRRVSSLRKLVGYCEAHGYRDFTIPAEECSDFVVFLRADGNVSSRTQQECFNDIKHFLQETGHKDDPIMETMPTTRFHEGADGQMHREVKDRYIHAPRRSHDRDKVCPPHNREEDYAAMNDAMKTERTFKNGRRRNADVAGIIILFLMFYLARRIGEVLGLTLEDISTYVLHDTGEVTHCIYLRNRSTDELGQKAKFRSSPRDTLGYNDNYMNENKLTKNCILLDDAEYQMLVDFARNTHEKARLNPKAYADSLADTVDPEKFHEEWGALGFTENHYLFLNSRGERLRYRAWYDRIVRYYGEAGVVLGRGKSPNHAWRHTILNILVNKLGYTKAEAADYAGHSNTASIDIYSRADSLQVAQMQATIKDYIDKKMMEYSDDEEHDVGR